MERLSITSDPALFRRARLWAADLAREAGLAEDDIRDLEVALSEACSNAHRHAYCGRTDGRLELTAERAEGGITVAVRDYGGAFDARAYRAPRLGDPAEGGYGLFLMRRLVDELELLNMEPGVQVILRKRRRAGSPE